MNRFLIALFCAVLAGGAVSALDVVTVPTKNVPCRMDVMVAVPDGYVSNDTTRYPVVYLLNGHSGDYRSWSTIVPLDSVSTAYGTIIVCPSGLDSWYWDSPVDTTLNMESFMIDDLIPYIDSVYRTRADRTGRAVTGLSMGGHGGLWLGLRHPDVFANAGSTSGGVDIRPFPHSWHMADRLGEYADNKEVWDSHTVINLVPSVVAGQVNIIFDCGTEDFFYGVNNNLHRALTERGIPHTYLTSPGAHNSAYWKRSILPQMQFFHTHFYVPVK